MLGAALALLMPAAGRAACIDSRPGEFRMVTEPPRPEYRHQLTRSQLSAVKGHGHMTSDRSHAGLTHTQPSLTMNPLVESRRMPNGSLCVALKRVEVTWKMAQLLVDIATEYRRGSCPYEQIVLHENQHVAISQNAFVAADRALRQQLADAVRRLEPFVFRGTPQQAATEAGNRLMAVARPILEKFDQDTRRQNAAIDTPESYRAVSARCRDW